MTSAIGVFTTPPVEASSVPIANGKFRALPARRSNWPNRLALGACLGVALLSPLPHASNLPLVWLFWAAVLGAVASVFAITRIRVIPAHPTGRILVGLGMTFAAFAGFQALPLAGWRGGLMVDVPGGSVVLRHLSFAPGASLLATVRLCSYVIFFTLAMRVGRDPANARRIGIVWFWLVAAQALVAILNLELRGDTGVFFEKTAFYGVATGTFVNRNSLATYLGMGLVLGLCLYRGSKGRHRAAGKARLYLAWGAMAVILVALVLTQSRMGVAASLVAALFVVLQYGHPLRNKVALVAAGLGIVLGAGSMGLFARMVELGSNDEHRAALYGQVAQMISNRPLTGFGLDSFPLVYQMFHAPPVTANFVWEHAHSTYLTLWAEAGIFMGSVPLIAGTIAFFALIRIARSGRSGRAMARAGAGALVLAGLHSLVDFSLEIQANVFLLLGLVALGLGPAQPRKEPHG